MYCRCRKCGRKLTDPESRRRGFGPECWDYVTSEGHGRQEAIWGPSDNFREAGSRPPASSRETGTRLRGDHQESGRRFRGAPSGNGRKLPADAREIPGQLSLFDHSAGIGEEREPEGGVIENKGSGL